MLEVKDSFGKGRGVFATKPIEEGVCFECSPIIEIPMKEISQIRRTVIGNYYFKWFNHNIGGAIALGFGSLYNHSYKPNANFSINFEKNTIDFYSLRLISQGEEITINYKGSPESKEKLWFSPV